MNGSTVRQFLKCGYSLCTKDLYILPNKSRILYNFAANRDYCTSWSMQQQYQQYNTIPLSLDWAERRNINSFSLVAVNCRYFSTTLPQNGPTALKQKSPPQPSDGSNKPKSFKEKPSDDNKADNQQPKSATEADPDADKVNVEPQSEEKLSLTAKFKKMYKDYWYVLLPVHIFTSTFWFAGFYYLSTSGVDIPALLQSMHISESVISKLRDSSLGHAAVAYLCYKIATPLRYTVTLGGTTVTIKYLSQWGYIRPVPTKAEIKQIIDDQKAKFQK